MSSTILQRTASLRSSPKQRKYHLNLTLSHQFLEQLKPEISSAVFGNVASLVTFRVGDRDAIRLGQELGQTYAPETITGMENFEICARLLNHGHQELAMLGKTLPPLGENYHRASNIVRRSRQR